MKYQLPDSAVDLLIKDGKLLMRTVTIYEIFKRFSHIIRLTTFRYEDFSAALLAQEQSPLLAEIHIQLLRTLIREDRQQQTWLGPPDIRDSVNIYLQLADHITWPAALRIYLSADPDQNSHIIEKLSNECKSYPIDVDIEVRLIVLEHLCDQFLLSNLARDEVVNGSNLIKHDTTCRSCSKPNGAILPCSKCPAVYHLKCSDPPFENPPADSEPYICALCTSNHVKGVSDCLTDDEKLGNLKRHDALGIDKHGRSYWHIIRRVFIVDETEDDVRYLTRQEQLEELFTFLKESRNDKNLIANLELHREEIERQMMITKDLYNNLPEDFKDKDGNYTKFLGQDGTYKNYVNYYTSSSLAVNKNQNPDRDINRSLANKFSMTAVNTFKWHGAIDGHSFALSATIKSTIFKFEASLPKTFVHPCWNAQRSTWMRKVNYAQDPKDFAIALSIIETCIKPVLFKLTWYESVGFTHLFRSTFNEREEMKKTDRQPRGFERREWFVQDIELSNKLGTVVKFSSKLKPVKHQVWKQKGEEYRITGLNGWFWRSRTHRPRSKSKLPKSQPYEWKSPMTSQKRLSSTIAQPKLPPVHDFLTKRTKIKSILILPDLELRRLARSGGMKETKSFSYNAKQNNYVWPYGMTPRPTFRTCWLYRNRRIDTMQDVAIQLRILHACIRWDDLQVKPPPSGQNVITTDESTVTIQLLKKLDRLPYLTHSEYLIRKTITPIEQPTKYRKVSLKQSKPSARSGLRVRRQTEEEEPKGPTVEELWVPENQLELWEIRQFDERIERQNQLLREKALREENEKRRKLEEEKRRNAELERRKRLQQEEEQKRLGSASTPTPQTPRPINIINLNTSQQQPRSAATTPVLRYFRTEQGQIIRLPASYLHRGTPLILRHVGPSNQTNTYIIRPQITNTNIVLNSSATSTTSPSVGTLRDDVAHDQHASVVEDAPP